METAIWKSIENLQQKSKFFTKTHIGDTLEMHSKGIGETLGTHWKCISNALGTHWEHIEIDTSPR